MTRRGHALAEMSGFGSVYDCGACGNVHVSIGPVSLTLTPDAYMQLVALIHTSAANFELWLSRRDQPSAGGEDGIPIETESTDDPLAP